MYLLSYLMHLNLTVNFQRRHCFLLTGSFAAVGNSEVGSVGVSPAQPARGSGVRRELSSGVRGKAPAENGFWRILKATRRSFLYLYDKIWVGAICISVPHSKF